MHAHRPNPLLHLPWIAAGVVWATAVAAGFAVLLDYSSNPGSPAAPPSRCPESIALANDRPTLLLFLHPRCPCSTATMTELDRLAARARGSLSISVFVLSDPAIGDAENGSLWRMARAIPGVDVRADPGGRIAGCFGARTSGEVLVFGPDRSLLFDGGITDGRGHQGDNAGSAAILELAAGRRPATRSAPVYGCSLRDDDPAGLPESKLP